MHEKLPLLMKSEGLTSSRLAELLGIQPSGISHLISGRNKPSYDLLQKILTDLFTVHTQADQQVPQSRFFTLLVQ